MERQKKNGNYGRQSSSSNNTGITLVSLVISIIVMLILAGVSINAVVGENGILTQAQEAALATELARIKEELEYMFLDFNIGNGYTDIGDFLTDKATEGEIDSFKSYVIGTDRKMIIKKDGYYFLVEESAGSYYATLMETDLSDISSGYTVVTAENFDSDRNINI